jgi:hypothetical protein
MKIGTEGKDTSSSELASEKLEYKKIESRTLQKTGALVVVWIMAATALTGLVQAPEIPDLDLSDNIAFFDDFEDSGSGGFNWVVTEDPPNQFGPVSGLNSQGQFDYEGEWSVHMYGEKLSPGMAYGQSPNYTLLYETDYIVTLDLRVTSPSSGPFEGWFTVADDGYVWLIIDGEYDSEHASLTSFWRKGEVLPPLDPLLYDKWYYIECRVHVLEEEYDVYLNGVYLDTLPFDRGGSSFFPGYLTVGDTSSDSDAYGEAYWDNILVSHLESHPWSDELGPSINDWTTIVTDTNYFGPWAISSPGGQDGFALKMQLNGIETYLAPGHARGLTPYYDQPRDKSYVWAFWFMVGLPINSEFKVADDGRIWLRIGPGGTNLQVYVDESDIRYVETLTPGVWCYITLRVDVENNVYALYLDDFYYETYDFSQFEEEYFVRPMAPKNLFLGGKSFDLSDGAEAYWDEIRLEADCDGDGLSDWEELNGYRGSYYHGYLTDPCNPDSDDDGLLDSIEVGLVPFDTDPSTMTIPTDKDTDDDGYWDGTEDQNGNGFRDGNDRLDTLSDFGIGVGPGETDPNLWDTDEDLLSDGQEFGLAWPEGYDSYLEWLADPNSDTGPAFVPDADGGETYTDPIDFDSDDDSMPDGWQDWNENSDMDLLEFEDRDLDGEVDAGIWDGGSGPGETSPTTIDTDDDTLSDYDEIELWGTDPTVADTDNDGLMDGKEVVTDPFDDDTDDDGLLDGSEDKNGNGFREGNDPTDSISDWEDGGGFAETSPVYWDTDGDGLSDGQELGLTMPEGEDTDQSKFQPDEDTLTETDPLDIDSDDDGLPDGYMDLDDDSQIDLLEFEDLNTDGKVDGGEWTGQQGTGETDPNHADTDGDGLTDYEEQEPAVDTNPISDDTDTDGMPDGWEVQYGLDPKDDSDAGGHKDSDLRTNLDEYLLGTDPTNPDTDGDLILDHLDTAGVAYNVGEDSSETFDAHAVVLDTITYGGVEFDISVAIRYALPNQPLPAISDSTVGNGDLNSVVVKFKVSVNTVVTYEAVVKVRYDPQDLAAMGMKGKHLLMYYYDVVFGGEEIWTLFMHTQLGEDTWRSPESEDSNHLVWAKTRHLGDIAVADSTRNDLDGDVGGLDCILQIDGECGGTDGEELNVEDFDPLIQDFYDAELVDGQWEYSEQGSTEKDIYFEPDGKGKTKAIPVHVTEGAFEIVKLTDQNDPEHPNPRLEVLGKKRFDTDQKIQTEDFGPTTPDFAILDNGDIYLVWRNKDGTDYADILFRKSTDGGVTWTDPVRVNDDPEGDARQEYPSIAVGSNGYIYVAWSDNRDVVHHIYFARSTDGGQSFELNVRVSDSSDYGYTVIPHVAVGSNDKVYVVWKAMGPGDPWEEYVHIDWATQGSGFGSDVRVDDRPNEDQKLRPVVAVGSQGYVYVAWENWRYDSDIDDWVDSEIYFSRSTDGGANWETDLRLNDELTENHDGHYAPDIAVAAVNPNDIIYVAWYEAEADDVYLAKSTTLGASFGQSECVPNSEGTPSIAVDVGVDTDSTLYVGWADNNDWGYVSTSHDNGDNFDNPIKMTDYALSSPPNMIVGDSGSLFMGYERWFDGDIYMSQFYPLNPGLTVIGGEQDDSEDPEGSNWEYDGRLMGMISEHINDETSDPDLSFSMNSYLIQYQCVDDGQGGYDCQDKDLWIHLKFWADSIGGIKASSLYVRVVPHESDPDEVLGTDSDNDGLSDLAEGVLQTNPLDKDTDDDGLTDGDEVRIYRSNPLNPHSDPDDLMDGWDDDGDQVYETGETPGEWNYWSSPIEEDTDGDGRWDDDEVSDFGPNVGFRDSPDDDCGGRDADGDGFCNGPTDPDSDADGLDDNDELTTVWTVCRDLNGDGDCQDQVGGLDEEVDVQSVPWNADADVDDLNDFGEIELGTDPNDDDTDRDTLGDGDEAEKRWVRYYEVHQRPPLLLSSALRFGYTGKTVELEKTMEGTSIYVWEVQLFPGFFDLGDFTRGNDWLLEQQVASGYEEIHTFYEVSLDSLELWWSHIAVVEYSQRTGNQRDIYFAIGAKTNPLSIDSDHDGIWDGGEDNQLFDLDTDGTSDANPIVTDIFVEVDWMEQVGAPLATYWDPAHELRKDAISNMRGKYRTQGFQLHVDLDQEIPHDDWLTRDEWNGCDEGDPDGDCRNLDGDHLFGLYFTDARFGAFFHLIMAHNPEILEFIGGEARGPSVVMFDNMFRIQFYDDPGYRQEAVVMHELGHLIIRHVTPTSDRFTGSPYCIGIEANQLHDKYWGSIMFGCGFLAHDYHPNRWREMTTEYHLYNNLNANYP